MKSRAFVVVVVAVILAVTGTGLAALQDRASAQSGLELRSMILQGNVTINGVPAADGFRVTAKIRNSAGDVIYTSAPAEVGKSTAGRYTALVVGPFSEGEGRTIEFWLDDQVISTNVTAFAPMLNGNVCLGCSWSLPILRAQNLDFAATPVATPTPSPSPTPTVVVLQPSLYSGRVLAGSSIPDDGTTIYAKVGDYTSPFAVIEDGLYRLVVNPSGEQYLDVPVVFLIRDVPAVQTSTFKGGEFIESFNLIFPNLPPAATATPAPPTVTPTPEPTRTPTPAPSPSPTATSTAEPTPIGSPTPTSDDEGGGGFCSSTAGGPASLGFIGMVALPLGLLFARKLRSADRAAMRDELYEE